MNYVTNAIPAAALIGRGFMGYPISKDILIENLKAQPFVSAVGHESTALMLSEYLGIEIPFNRISIVTLPGDSIFVAALRGPRIAEGKILTADEVAERGFSFIRIDINVEE